MALLQLLPLIGVCKVGGIVLPSPDGLGTPIPDCAERHFHRDGLTVECLLRGLNLLPSKYMQKWGAISPVQITMISYKFRGARVARHHTHVSERCFLAKSKASGWATAAARWISQARIMVKCLTKVKQEPGQPDASEHRKKKQREYEKHRANTRRSRTASAHESQSSEIIFK